MRAMRASPIRRAGMLAGILLLPCLAVMAEQMTLLLIEGQQGQAKLIQVQGKNYVAVEDVARLTGGSLRFSENQIVLTLPRGADSSQTGPQAPSGFSGQFLSAGIETMRQILAWHAALKTIIERSYPMSDEWFASLERQVQASLKFADAAATTDMDRKALPLLVYEFNTMSALSDKYLKINARRDYVAPDSLNKDPLAQKLLTCWRSLESMASSRQFVDDGSCR